MVKERHGFKTISDTFGDRRVVKGISLQTMSGHIAHALTKHPLSTADIFLFNIGKCVDTFTEINYEMLERNTIY